MTSLQRRQVGQFRSPVSPTSQYDPYGPQLGYLSENIHRLLTERECSIFDRGLADYHRRRNIRSFVECLSLVLNTNQKRQLLLPIRDTYVKPSDLGKFNQLVQDHGLATSLRRKKKDEEKAKSGGGVHRVEVKRDVNGDWGFSIRGGNEHGIGVYVSWVEPGSGAQKGGLQIGDQILKANEQSFENISHYNAVMLLKGAKKVSLWVLSRGRVPSSRMTHKVYRWMSPEGRSVSPPPDPFDLQDQTSIGEQRAVSNEADERKVTIMVDSGQELGISIRGGAEHGLGVYLSVVEEGSVAENYGLKPGDQLLEVNGISFQNIVHSEAANALRAQPCMVMRLKDVGKIPHSRITTYGQTEWKSPPGTLNKSSSSNKSQQPVFKPGVGTQVMHGQHQTDSIQGRGMMNEVARSVLSTQELETFNYYTSQYDQHSLSVDDLVTSLLELLDSPEKLQLLSEVRAVVKARDLQKFNDLTVHKEISAKKENRSNFQIAGSSTPTSPLERTPTGHNQSEDFIMSPPPAANSGGEDLSSEDGGRDRVPQKLVKTQPHQAEAASFNIPPPPEQSSTPSGPQSSEAWGSQWNDSSLLSSTHNTDVEDAPTDISAIEAKVRSQTEAELRKQFEEEQKQFREEQQRLLEQEKQDKEMTLRREREQFERVMREKEKQMKTEIEQKLAREAEEKIQREIQQKEEALASKYAKKAEASLDQPGFEQQVQQIEERTRMELEEKIWKEAEEQMRIEYEAKMEEEKSKLQSEVKEAKSKSKTDHSEVESRLRSELEQKFKREFDDKMRTEKEELKRQQQQELKRKEREEKANRDQEVARLEAEEQARIEMEDRIRKEAEAVARAEYGARLQRETEEKAKLAEEVKARRQAEERRQREEQNTRNKPPTRSQYEEPEAAEESEESDDDVPDRGPGADTGPVSVEEERMLETQRKIREAEEREQQRREEQERLAAQQARQKQDDDKKKKLEVQRKREENIRRREQERKQKEHEAKLKRDQQQKDSPKASRNRFTVPGSRNSPLTTRTAGNGHQKRPKPNQEPQKVKVNFGEEKPQKTKQQLIADERLKAEEKLQRRLRREQEKKQTGASATAHAQTEGGKSYGGYDNLHGEILTLTVTKVCKKLGIAIDGGANTKQKAVIVREISPEGCAAQTAEGLRVGQQVLAVGGESLFGKRHKDVVLTVKSAFEGPMEKTLELVVLDN